MLFFFYVYVELYLFVQTKQRFQKLSDAEKAEYEEKMAAYKGEKDDKQSAAKKKKSSKENEVIENGHNDSMED